DEQHLAIAGFIVGIGGGLVFAPLSLLVLSSVPVSMRTEGASMFALTRSIGSSVGISYVHAELRHASVAQEVRLNEAVRPGSPIIEFALPDMDFSAIEALASLHRMVLRQATMAAYVDVFWLICFIALATAPLAYLIRPPRIDPASARP